VWRKLIELVNLTPVLVVDGYTWLVGIGRVAWIGFDNQGVEIFVERFVVDLEVVD
jgi:hypothetical protein